MNDTDVTWTSTIALQNQATSLGAEISDLRDRLSVKERDYRRCLGLLHARLANACLAITDMTAMKEPR